MHSNLKINQLNRISMLILASLLLMPSSSVIAANEWGAYRGVEKNKSHGSGHQPRNAYGYSSYKGYANPYGTPLPPQKYPIRPPINKHTYPQKPYQPNHPYPVYPQQNGLTIIYNHQFPQHTEYQSQSYGYVNGEQGRIESSTYTLISDWRRYGLPAPQVGMHWIYQKGRYIQIHNDR